MTSGWECYMNAVNLKQTDAWKECGYIQWIREQWRAWREETGKQPPPSPEDQVEFDAWLEAKWGRIG